VVRRIGFAPRTAVSLVKPMLIVLTKRDWTGMENIPKSGGVIIAVNHMSEFDPFVVAHYVYDAGRWPQFLAKSSLFKIPVLGPVVRAVRQIPVHRGTVDASKALDAAVAALGRGEAVIIYPEGTTPKKGDLWPGKGKTGIARLWLDTGVPVIPVATWGAQQVFDPRTRKVKLRPNTPVTVRAGKPIDLSKFAGMAPTARNLYAITDEIMSVLRTMVGEIRGETPPDASASAAPDASATAAPDASASAAPAANGSATSPEVL
jgi:1-acyl-sn-glycerol-3-phosphate acyltransferase